MNPEALDADCAALAAAGSLAEEALALHRDALAILEQGWQSQSGSAATDVLRGQCGEAAELVTALHDATGDFRALRDAVEYGVAASIDQPYHRLSDRPPAAFETAEPLLLGGAAAPAPPLAPPPAPAWTPGAAVPPLPDLGGALVGLIGQIADAVSLDATEEGVDLGTTLSSERPTEPLAESTAAAPKPESPAEPPASLPAQATSPSAASGAAVPPVAAPPLLAAERPPDPPLQTRPDPVPEPEVPSATVTPAVEPTPDPTPEPTPPDPETPCEIAADALPQIGQ